jgi:hypothetical protein
MCDNRAYKRVDELIVLVLKDCLGTKYELSAKLYKEQTKRTKTSPK